MTATLVETSILGRLANPGDTDFALARAAVAELHRQGDWLLLTAQSLVEFRNFATRPKAVNGLGLSSAEAAQLAAAFESAFPLLDETPAIYPAWRAMADTLGVVGKQVHDARLAAVCNVHGVSRVLTFNVQHFRRFATYGPGFVVLHPRDVVAAAPTP